jgi:hypothetical protein
MKCNSFRTGSHVCPTASYHMPGLFQDRFNEYEKTGQLPGLFDKHLPRLSAPSWRSA